MGKTTTYSRAGGANWDNIYWDSGTPNGIDDIANIDGPWAGVYTLTVPAGLTYTIGTLQTNDSLEVYHDFNIAGGNATTSRLNFQTSGVTPSINSVDGGVISVLLAGNQGLSITGGNLTTDRITISNVNNTITGPITLRYSTLTTISGKLTARSSLNITNAANITYSGILGIEGSVDLTGNSDLNIRNLEFVGNSSSNIYSTDGSFFRNVPSSHRSSIKISTPIVLNNTDSDSSQYADNQTVEYAGLISGVSPAASTTAMTTIGMNNVLASGTTTFRLSHPANTFTGGPALVLCQSTSDTYDGRIIMEYSTIANSGVASSVGAGTTDFMSAWRHSTYRCIGAGGTSNRRLASFGSIAGNYNLENNGTGPIIFNSSIASSFGHWPVLAGTNLDLNEIVQPTYFTKPLVKDGTGRWCLSS
jgi:hypothetical protein